MENVHFTTYKSSLFSLTVINESIPTVAMRIFAVIHWYYHKVYTILLTQRPPSIIISYP